MIIRSKTFRQWFAANLKDSARDIACGGADCGWYGITYTTDCVKLFDRFEDELWTMLADASEQCGAANVGEFMSGFARSDMLDTPQGFKTLVVWFAAEELAREITAD